MESNEIFDSELNTKGTVAGVYEHDGEVGYFYLYDLTKTAGERVIAALRVSVGAPDHTSDEVNITWSPDQIIVGLFIQAQLCAAFDTEQCKPFGGEPQHRNSIPDTVLSLFSLK